LSLIYKKKHPVISTKREYNSETKDNCNIEGANRMTSTQQKKVEGIGPTSKEGIPISLRSVSWIRLIELNIFA
jgi:hypothetical protein